MATAAVLAGFVVIGGVAVAQEADRVLAIEMPSKVPGGETAKLSISLPADGHLLLLDVRRNGQVRVLFPRRPIQTSFIPGGEYDLDRLHLATPYSFNHDKGVVVALWSSTPFAYGDFVQYGHWAVTYLPRGEFVANPVLASLALARRMTSNGVRVASTVYDRRPPQIRALDKVETVRYASERWEYREYYNYLRIQNGCPSGTRDRTGAGEYCWAPEPQRRSVPVEPPPAPVYVPPAEPQAPPARVSTPAGEPAYVAPRRPL